MALPVSNDKLLSIKNVRPVTDRAEALEYLRDMCVYWYEKRPAFPGSPEALLLELGKWFDPAGRSQPTHGAHLAPQTGPAAPAIDPRVLAQLVQSAERVARMNKGAPGVAELMAAVQRLQASAS